ncbi:hypothetical protein EON67_09240 [archaeon]|nr:MAG: hypothetical protein EON67_09240 [archaeon]
MQPRVNGNAPVVCVRCARAKVRVKRPRWYRVVFIACQCAPAHAMLQAVCTCRLVCKAQVVKCAAAVGTVHARHEGGAQQEAHERDEQPGATSCCASRAPGRRG